MPALATTHSLSNYPKLPISRYPEQLKQADGKATGIDISYQHNGKEYDYSIKVTTTPANYGGYRYWWLCPKCHKRVGVLYCAGIYVCRHCIGANYQTQLLQPLDRKFKRIAELRQRLGWAGGLAHGMGSRPKGMHKKTYDRLVWEYCNVAEAILYDNMQRLGISEHDRANRYKTKLSKHHSHAPIR